MPLNTPKERFQARQEVAAHWNGMVGSIIFDEACDAAMNQLVFEQHLAASPEGQSAIAAHFREDGALRFIQILKNLSVPTEPRKPNNIGRLNE